MVRMKLVKSGWEGWRTRSLLAHIRARWNVSVDELARPCRRRRTTEEVERETGFANALDRVREASAGLFACGVVGSSGAARDAEEAVRCRLVGLTGGGTWTFAGGFLKKRCLSGSHVCPGMSNGGCTPMLVCWWMPEGGGWDGWSSSHGCRCCSRFGRRGHQPNHEMRFLVKCFSADDGVLARTLDPAKP